MPISLKHRSAVVLITNFVTATCALSFAASASAEPAFQRPDPRETRRVQAYLDSKDCPGAVKAVKDGVKARQPDVLLMAGRMMEDGVCMKADWEKAVNLYDMAYQAGSLIAWSARVAALAVAGRDNGRALWYVAQKPISLPPYCYPAADPLKAPDAFNAELERMPSDLFKACVYMAGVTHEVFGHAQFPPIALYHGMQGELTMKFVPSSGTIAWTFENSAGGVTGVRHMATAQFDDERKIQKSLLTYVTARGKFALERYARPEGIDPRIMLPGKYLFEIQN